MADVSYVMGQLAADALRWQKQPDAKWYGVAVSTWKPAAGKVKIGTGEYGPQVDAWPSKLVLSLGVNRLTLYVRGTPQNPIVDGVGIIGTVEPWEGVLKAWSKNYQSVITAIGRQQAWDAANPMYKERPVKKTAKSKLNPDQLEVG